MTLVVDPPLGIRGVALRVVSKVSVTAHGGRLGVVATGEKTPLAILVGTGADATLIAIDGSEIAPEEIGLSPDQLP